MAKRRKASVRAPQKTWFVYQLTKKDSDTLAQESGWFESDKESFNSIEAHVRKQAKACGFDQYIMLDRSGCMFYASGKTGSKHPDDRALLQQWAAEDQANGTALGKRRSPPEPSQELQ
mgnify:CR=1 FL=1